MELPRIEAGLRAEWFSMRGDTGAQVCQIAIGTAGLALAEEIYQIGVLTSEPSVVFGSGMVAAAGLYAVVLGSMDIRGFRRKEREAARQEEINTLRIMYDIDS
jgi:hypothetical protein